MTKKLLITGFDPFGGETINPAWEAVKLLSDKIGSFSLTKLEIPTVFGKGARLVVDAAEQLHPDVILCIGQAGGRSSVTPERIAVNIRDAKITDNEGNRPQGLHIVPNGPAAYFATIDVDAMVAAAQAQGYPATASNSAGAFPGFLHRSLRTELSHTNWSARMSAQTLCRRSIESVPVTRQRESLVKMQQMN